MSDVRQLAVRIVGLVGAGWEWLNRLGHRVGNFHIGFLQITIVTKHGDRNEGTGVRFRQYGDLISRGWNE